MLRLPFGNPYKRLKPSLYDLPFFAKLLYFRPEDFMITTENTELVALLGYPVEHTKSPELFSYFEQEFATKELGWAKQ
jgi:hypothetical protein